MTFYLPPQPGAVLDSIALLVQLLTITHHQGHRAAAAVIGRMDDTTVRGLAHVMIGSLYAATEIQAGLLGVDVAEFIQTLGLNVAAPPRQAGDE